MKGHHDLVTWVCQMRDGGYSVDEIVSTLGVSGEVVHQIVRKFETEEVVSARTKRFTNYLYSADDLDKKWKVSHLMQALRPNTITQNAIIRHFQQAKTSSISMRELMDLAIPQQEHPKPGYQLAPLLKLPCVGIDGFWSLVGSLTQVRLGEVCHGEWRKRLGRLKGCPRITGGPGSWSKACKPPDWLARAVASIYSNEPNPERNRQILQMRKEGIPRREVARRFGLSAQRVSQFERKDQAERVTVERRAKLQEEIRIADDPEKLWPIIDLVDALGLIGATKTRLLQYSKRHGVAQISLRELMDMCLDGPVDRWGFKAPPLLRVAGIGQKWFWSVVNGLTNADLGSRCNEEWSKRLPVVKKQSRVAGRRP